MLPVKEKYHYTYYSYEEFGRGYIGKRSCHCNPQEDVKYFGSYMDKTFKPTQKIILETYDTAEEAIDDEIKIQRFFKVVENPHFANKAYQTSNGFRGSSESARKGQANRTLEQRSEAARKALISYTSEKRSEAAKRGKSNMTPEQRSEAVRKQHASKTPEQRSEIAKKREANMAPGRRSEIAIKREAGKTPEQRSEAARKAHASLTPEQRSELGRKGQANRTLEQRSEAARKGYANMTPEQRSEFARIGSIIANAIKFQCTITGFISNAGPLSNYQKARGIDKSNRVRLDQ